MDLEHPGDVGVRMHLDTIRKEEQRAFEDARSRVLDSFAQFADLDRQVRYDGSHYLTVSDLAEQVRRRTALGNKYVEDQMRKSEAAPAPKSHRTKLVVAAAIAVILLLAWALRYALSRPHSGWSYPLG